MLDSHAMYILDCASELGEVSPMEYAVLNMDPQAQKAFNERSENLVGADGVANFCREQLESIPIERQYVMALSLMASGELEGLWKAYQGRVDFLVELKIGEDLNWRNPGSFALWGESGEKVFSTSFDISEPNVTRFLNYKCEGPLLRWQSDVELFRQAIDWATQRPASLHKTLNQLVVGVKASSLAVNAEVRRELEVQLAQERQSFVKTLRAEQQRAKRAIKKAVKLFEAQGKQETVNLLISGSEVTIEHPSSLFKFVVKPHSAGWLLRKTVNPGGTTPFTLELYTKENIFLARLCVLFKDTPVLDQLMALSLFIESGDEAEILQKANWFAVEAPAKEWIESNKPEYVSKVSLVGTSAEDGMSLAMSQFNRVRQQYAPFESICKQWVSQHLADKFSYSELPSSVKELMVEFNQRLVEFRQEQCRLLRFTRQELATPELQLNEVFD